MLFRLGNPISSWTISLLKTSGQRMLCPLFIVRELSEGGLEAVAVGVDDM